MCVFKVNTTHTYTQTTLNKYNMTKSHLTWFNLISSPDEDEVFEFPAMSPSASHLEPKSITLMTGSAQRISVRFQRATTSQATQTDPLWPDNAWNGSASGSHTFPKMRCRPHRKNSKNKGFACWENETSCQERRESQNQLEEEQINGVMPLHQHYTPDAKVRNVLFPYTVI